MNCKLWQNDFEAGQQHIVLSAAQGTNGEDAVSVKVNLELSVPIMY